MKKTALLFLVIAVIAGGCKGRSNSRNAGKTETMAPAAPASTAAETTDPMTQTVDVEDSRSVAEGGDTAGASDTATAVKKKTGAAATSRKTPKSQSRPAGRTQ